MMPTLSVYEPPRMEAFRTESEAEAFLRYSIANPQPLDSVHRMLGEAGRKLGLPITDRGFVAGVVPRSASEFYKLYTEAWGKAAAAMRNAAAAKIPAAGVIG